MADLTPLSSAAQAVLDTMHRSYDHEPTRRILAAGVLRAAADQLTPYSVEEVLGAAFCRNKILDIAFELENAK